MRGLQLPNDHLIGLAHNTGRYAVTTTIISPYSDELPIVLAQFDRLTDAIPLAISEARRRHSEVRVEDWRTEQSRKVLFECN